MTEERCWVFPHFSGCFIAFILHSKVFSLQGIPRLNGVEASEQGHFPFVNRLEQLKPVFEISSSVVDRRPPSEDVGSVSQSGNASGVTTPTFSPRTGGRLVYLSYNSANSGR